MTTSEASLLDTNVLVYAADETSPFHPTAKAIREKGLRGEISLCIRTLGTSDFGDVDSYGAFHLT